MRLPVVVANWKMNGSMSFVETMSSDLLDADGGLSNVSVVVAPPYLYVESLVRRFSGERIEVGVQDISAHDEGAYTGEVCAEMAADLGAKYAIVGHSERRAYHSESDTLVAVKTAAALSAGLTPICCVGESLAEREAGQAETVVGGQVKAIASVFTDPNELKRLIFAYEPVWAIGTGKTAQPEEAQAMHDFIRRQLGAVGSDICILYGGSVKPENAEELFCQPDIDGGLIGGASLKPRDFIAICQAATVSEN